MPKLWGAPWPRLGEGMLMHAAEQSYIEKQFEEILSLLEELRQEMLRNLTELMRWEDDGGA
jgi:hypothetical protein